jgi:hypothetical protein
MQLIRKQIMPKIKRCTNCKEHKTIPDPDPHDWFRSGDMAVVCSIAKNPKQDKKSEYVSDRQDRRIVQSLIGPWDWDDIMVPEWCPKGYKETK